MPSSHLKIREILFTRPHLIHQTYLSSILSGLNERIGLSEGSVIEAFKESHPVQAAGTMEAEVEVPNSIAIVQVHGTLVHRGGWLEGCGIRSYEAIRDDIEEALKNPNVSAILLDIDSGGGECAGLFDFTDWLKQAGQKKPIYSFAHDFAFSAAYAIASCGKKFFVAQAGEVGSIGVVAVHYDVSGANQKAGVVVTPIYRGAKKVDYSSHAPLGDGARADMQYSIDATYDRFVKLVSENRGVAEDAVRATEAGCFIATDAISNGLADKVASFDMVVSEIFADISAEQESGHSALSNATAKPEGNNMFKLLGKKKAETKPAEDEEDKNKPAPAEGEAGEGDEDPQGQVEQEPEAEGEGDEEQPNPDDEEGTPEEKAQAEGYQAALEVVQLAALSGKSINGALKMLEKGMTTDEARAHLLKQGRTPTASDVKGQNKGNSADGVSRMSQKMNAKMSKKGN